MFSIGDKVKSTHAELLNKDLEVIQGEEGFVTVVDNTTEHTPKLQYRFPIDVAQKIITKVQ